MQPPATAPANQRPEPAPRPRRSPRLNPEPGRVCAIKGPPGNPPHRTEKAPRMARTYPFTVPYNQSLGASADPLSFASLRLVDLRNGQSQYLSTLQQLVDALPKTEDPSSRYALQGHIARPTRNACNTRCGQRFGGCCRLMASFATPLTPSSTISHARDGVWSYEGVM